MAIFFFSATSLPTTLFVVVFHGQKISGCKSLALHPDKRIRGFVPSIYTGTQLRC